MAEFNTSIKNQGAVSIINLKGYLDAHTAPILENNFVDLIDKSCYQIVVDFKRFGIHKQCWFRRIYGLYREDKRQ